MIVVRPSRPHMQAGRLHHKGACLSYAGSPSRRGAVSFTGGAWHPAMTLS